MAYSPATSKGNSKPSNSTKYRPRKKKSTTQAAELLIANKNLQQAKEKTNRAKHLYAFISQVNQKIVRVKDEATLFRNACNIALEFGRFKMAWIGIFDNKRKKIVLVEQCGLPEEEIGAFTDATNQSEGAQNYVLRKGNYYICNDIENNTEVKNQIPFARQHGIRSYMVLPIKKSGSIIGTLNLYSSQPDFAGKEEIKLLVEVCGDISFALDLFEKEKQHKKEEEEIKASEMLYHSLFDNMLEGFAHCKMVYENGLAKDLIYLDVNSAFEKLTGLKNVVGKKITELLPGIFECNQQLIEVYGRVALTGKSERVEVYVQPMNTWLDIAIYSIEKGYFTAVFDVITEKKKAEEKLIYSERHFRALIEHGADMKSLSDAGGKITYGSPSIKKGLGYTTKEFVLKYPHLLIHPADIESYLKKRGKLLLTPGKSFSFQQRRLHKNGNWIWCEGTLTNLLNEPGVYALVSNFRNISDRKKEEDLKAFNKSNLAALINNTEDLMWSVDTDFNLITANKPFNEITKINFGSAIKKGVNVLTYAYTPEMTAHYKQSYERAFAGESYTEISHFDIPSEFWQEVSYSPIRKGGKVIGAACHSRDITTSKKAEKEILRSEAKLKEAQAMGHIGNWEIDMATGIHTWSDELYKIYGIAKGEVEPSAEAMLLFLHPDDTVLVQKQIGEALITLSNSSANFRFIRKDGAIKYGHTEWRFELDENKKPIRLYGIFQDITERKEAEAQIKESEIKYSSLIDQAADAITVVHFDGSILEVNKSAETLFGYAKAELLTMKMKELVFAGDPSPRLAEVAKGKGIVYERRMKRKDSTPVEVEISAGHVDDGRIMTIFRNISERKKTEYKVAELNNTIKEAYYQQASILNALPYNIALLDDKGTILAVNEAWKNFADENNHQGNNHFVGDNYLQVCTNATGADKEDGEKMFRGIMYVLEGGKNRFELEYPCHSPREKRWFSVQVRPLSEAKHTGVVVIHIDITAQKLAHNAMININNELEERVNLRTGELLAANKALEAFSYSVSHDLRSPVRSVMGFAKLIKKDHGDSMNEDARELFSHIEAGGRRMNSIINDLLSFAKWGKEKLQLTEVNMTSLFNYIWENTQVEWPNHAVLQMLPLPKVQADMAMLRQVVVNLISNAVKYSSKKENPLVKVGYQEKNGEVIFYVSDNGAGFDMKNYDRLFGAFQRLHGMSDFEGTGIGLALVKTIIEKHNGRVWAEGKVDEGATFYFTLPLV